MATQSTVGYAPRSESARAIFECVLVGVDRSPESVEAARQADILVDPAGTLRFVAAWMTPPPPVAYVATPVVGVRAVEAQRRKHAGDALIAAQAALCADVPVTAWSVCGTPWRKLLEAIDAGNATLVAVGSHGAGRARGIAIGSTATEIVHKAPCSVLVARRAGRDFPKRIVVGVDGSPESAGAYAAAAGLAERFGATLWTVVAHGGRGVDRTLVATIVDHHHEDLPDEPVPALVAASTEADLVVVGSRGLHGLKALGSVSERVAHDARCSTLIVRG
jgi:nucleotide-binding universal stress UspA family protein